MESAWVAGSRANTTISHHVHAQSSMRHLCCNIEIKPSCSQAGEIIWEALPVPWQTFGQHHLGDILDPFHELNQPMTVVRTARRETDTTVTGEDCRDAQAR
jgi:hypothetical protein